LYFTRAKISYPRVDRDVGKDLRFKGTPDLDVIQNLTVAGGDRTTALHESAIDVLIYRDLPGNRNGSTRLQSLLKAPYIGHMVVESPHHPF
jgi:hypothetical protein